MDMTVIIIRDMDTMSSGDNFQEVGGTRGVDSDTGGWVEAWHGEEEASIYLHVGTSNLESCTLESCTLDDVYLDLHSIIVQSLGNYKPSFNHKVQRSGKHRSKNRFIFYAFFQLKIKMLPELAIIVCPAPLQSAPNQVHTKFKDWVLGLTLKS